jgi:hypothetical protein
MSAIVLCKGILKNVSTRYWKNTNSANISGNSPL